MMKTILWILPFVLVPTLAIAQPGSGTDLTKVQREIEAMQRDGRWERLLAEGEANKQAFEAMRQAERRAQPSPVYTSSVPARQRRRP